MMLAHMEKQSTIFPYVKTRNEFKDRSLLMMVGIFCCFILPLSWTQRFQYNKLFISEAPLVAVPPFLFVVLHRSPGRRCCLAVVLKKRWR